MAAAADVCPPLKTVLKGVVAVMEHADTVIDVQEDFSKLALRIKGFQMVFDEYAHEDVPPVIRTRLEKLSKELEPIGTMIQWKMKRSIVKRTIKALKDVEDIQDAFDKLATLMEAFQLECSLNIERNVQNIVSQELLEKLNAVLGAGINSQTGGVCMEGTRVGILNDVRIWSRTPDVARIFWLDGMAGTGKSAIARSICQDLLKDRLLGASFFCSRGARDDVALIIPTLAASLAHLSAPYRLALLDLLQEMPDAAYSTVELQVKNLLEKPLRNAFGDKPPTLVFVVDALDECADPTATKNMVAALVSRSSHMPVKFFLTSRPERHIQMHFSSKCSHLHRILRLHDIEQHIVQSDINLYCHQRLQEIREAWQNADPPYEFPQQWPSGADIETLTNRAGTLFIYAFTALNHINKANPRSRLQELISVDSAPQRPLTKPLDDMYTLILKNALNADECTEMEILQAKKLLAIILVLRESITVSALAHLMGLSTQHLRGILDGLRAVVYVPQQNDASFEDYLTSHERAPEAFRIDLFHGHEALAAGCIHIMDSDALHFNVSGCRSSYLPNTHQTFATIPASLVYSCLHWVHHLIRIPNPSSLLPLIYSLLQKKILFWIEVLSASANARLAMGLLHRVLTAENMTSRLPPEIIAFFRDAKDFIMLGYNAIEFSAPHIYLSVLPSLSPSSMIAESFWPQFQNLLKYNVAGIRRSRGPLLQMSGHTGTVFAVAFSPNGTRVVSGSGDDTVRIWDARSGDLIMQPLEGHRGEVISVVFSPNGTRIVSGSLDNTVRIWNAITGELVIDPHRGHRKGVSSVSFSPDGTRIISGSLDHTLRLWHAETGDPLLDAFEGHTDMVRSVLFSPDGRQVVSCSDDRTIRLWDVLRGEEVMKPLRGHTGIVYSVAFSPDGTRIASGSGDSTIKLWDARTGAPIIDPLVGHTDSVLSVAFSPDGTRIVSSSTDKTVRLWDAATGRPVKQPFEGHGDLVWSVGFSPDGRTVVSGSGDKTIRLWRANVMDALPSTYAAPSDTVLHDGTALQGSRLAVLDDNEHPAPSTNVKPRNTPSVSHQGHEGRVRCVAFTPDGTQVVSGSEDKTVSLWNAQTGVPVLEPLRGHRGLVKCLAVSPDGSYIASGSADKTIRLWNARTGQQVANPLSGHDNWVHSLVFSPDGTQLVSGSSDRTIRIWDARTGMPVMKPLKGHAKTIWSVAFSPDGIQIVSGSADATLQLWNATTGDRLMEPLKGHSDRVFSIAFSPDGARIISGSADATIRLWDARTGDAAMEPLRGHTDTVTSVIFSPDGEVIASGSADTTVWLWNATTGVPVMKPLEGHSDKVSSVAFSPDGTRLVSGSYDNTIRVWDVTPGDSWLVSQGGQGSTIWSTIATSMRLSAAPRSTHLLNSNGTEPAQSSSTSQIVSEELLDPSQFRLESGWIKGPRDEIIMWIPKDYWRGVLMPRTKVLIGRYRAMLDVSRFAHGDRWTECYTPSMTSSNP
ncbi:hypothetical protein CERSUDRAFT_115528 [Gelatoporia subvermispora B]|uniref:NACHT domain-containing protein n=1 Tax=Ceriporiopsis subvermispora (strain B) TaxID=914234 RepID=M2QWJ2_CERS8|nr:hypothetical protein CERSUDRAFT_115528 [Gelatoporia subvermispora B]